MTDIKPLGQIVAGHDTAELERLRAGKYSKVIEAAKALKLDLDVLEELLAEI